MSRRAFFGIGSNLADRWASVQFAVDGLAAADHLLGVSSIYETAPVGGPDGQGPYLNCAVVVETDRAPIELLATANRLEDERGRVRLERFGPRTLDIDVLWIDGYRSHAPELTVPHPRMWERSFVLAPLEDLDPALVPAGWRTTLASSSGPDQIRRVGEMLHHREDILERLPSGP